ncbi:MAG TPA: hypothetical protein VN802_16855 [Stellaceae bacterium]|nr:hypothetical protein [Stellaceae bacterium]
MPTACRRAFLVLVLILAGCVAPGPPFASVASTIPPPPPGSARIFLYRWLEPYETVAMTTAYFNGSAVGVTETGTVLYRDVAPGRYTISVWSEGVYPDQFKTVTVGPGQVVYARIESLSSWSVCGGFDVSMGGAAGCWDTFVVNIMDPAVALSEMQSLRFIRG